MEWIFGKRLTPDEMMRKNQRALNRAMRDLDRERMKMEQQEKRIIMDIKKLAKENQMDAVKIMAKDLVRTRKSVRKFMLMKANIQAVSLKIQTLKSQNTMSQAMKGKGKGDESSTTQSIYTTNTPALSICFTAISHSHFLGVTRAMQNMNRQLNLPQIQRILQEFEKQSEIMDMKEEMINDAIDDAMEDEGDEEESDAVVAQVLDELGLQLGDQLANLSLAEGTLNPAAAKTPQAIGATGGGGAAATGGGAVPAAPSDADADLQARLDNLRRE